jgi:hypothetical protein
MISMKKLFFAENAPHVVYVGASTLAVALQKQLGRSPLRHAVMQIPLGVFLQQL